MSIKESALAAITSIAQGDFVRAVTSAGASRRVTVSNLAKAIIESYAGSSLAGESQSVKAALDQLNVTSPTAPTLTTTGGSATGSITNYKAYGRLRFLTLRTTLTESVAAGSNAYTGTISDRPSVGAGSVGYAGSIAFVLGISTAGAITVRVIGGTAPSGADPYINVMYLV